LLFAALVGAVCVEANAATFSFRPTAASADVDGPGDVDAREESFVNEGSLTASTFADGTFRVGQQVGVAWSEARVSMYGSAVPNADGYSSGYVVSSIKLRVSGLGYAVWGSSAAALGSAVGGVVFDGLLVDGRFDPSTLLANISGGQPNRILWRDETGFAFETHTNLGGNCCATSTSASFSAVWGQQRPGSSASTALPSSMRRDDDPSEDDPSEEPAEVAGAFLVNPAGFLAPITTDYGAQDPIYFAGQDPSASDDVRGYYFAVAAGSPNFASFQLPELESEQTYTLWTNGAYHDVTGSDVVDFTTMDPEGVSRFYLLGVGEHALDELPHVFAATFAAEGVADFIVADMEVLDESDLMGDFNNDSSIDAGDYVVWRKEFSTSDTYDLWRANFGGAAANAIASAVPESTSCMLALVAIVWLAALRPTARRRSKLAR
jgi:hypothetical protein